MRWGVFLLSVGLSGSPLTGFAQSDYAGEFSGHIALQAWDTKPVDGEGEGFNSGHLSLNYQYEPVEGVILDGGFWASAKINERNDGDYVAAIQRNLLMHRAALSLQNTAGWSAILGRQAIDLPWMTDYIEGVQLMMPVLPEVKLDLVWAHRQAVAELDEVSNGFEKLNENSGVFAMDATWQINDVLSLAPYYYHARDYFRAPGLRLTAEYDLSDKLAANTALQWVAVKTGPKMLDEEGERLQDGGLIWLEQGLEWDNWAFNAGYIRTRHHGLGGLELTGDQGPLEEGNYLFAPRAKSTWGGLSYEYGPFTVAAIHARSHYDSGKEDETNLTLEYTLLNDLSIELAYIDVRNDTRTEGYRIVKTALTYPF